MVDKKREKILIVGRRKNDLGWDLKNKYVTVKESGQQEKSANRPLFKKLQPKPEPTK